MARPAFRSEFDPEQDFVVRKPLRLNGEALAPGTIFPKEGVPTRRLRQLFDGRLLAYPSETGKDLARPPAPERFGRWLDRLRRPKMNGAQAPRPRAHLPDNMRTSSMGIRPAKAAVGVPSEFDDGDLEPVLTRAKINDGARPIAELVAEERPAPRAAPLDPDRPGANVTIPDAWMSLPWPKLLQLASNFSLVRLMNKVEAIDAVEAELARRARAT